MDRERVHRVRVSLLESERDRERTSEGDREIMRNAKERER